eukprot:14187899-Alexandrium_andersonii.AAC.1
MSASLVGSEMCIRDRGHAGRRRGGRVHHALAIRQDRGTLPEPGGSRDAGALRHRGRDLGRALGPGR